MANGPYTGADFYPVRNIVTSTQFGKEFIQPGGIVLEPYLFPNVDIPSLSDLFIDLDSGPQLQVSDSLHLTN